MNTAGLTKPAWAVVGLIALLILIAVGESGSDGQPTPTPDEPSQEVQVSTQTPKPTPQPTQQLTPATHQPTPAPTQRGRTEGAQDEAKEQAGVLVTRVVDGDTIKLQDGRTVRYIGINTPESVDPRRPVECFGKQATQRNKELVLHKRVRLEKDISETDRYGRLLRYVYVNDTFVNETLVREGYAYASAYPPDVRHNARFQAAEQQARTHGRGLWGECQDTTATPATPIPTPATVQTEANQTAGECNIKGNISAEDEKIYHIPGCTSYNVTKINTERGERYFCTEQEAKQAGWRKAMNCL